MAAPAESGTLHQTIRHTRNQPRVGARWYPPPAPGMAGAGLVGDIKMTTSHQSQPRSQPTTNTHNTYRDSTVTRTGADGLAASSYVNR